MDQIHDIMGRDWGILGQVILQAALKLILREPNTGYSHYSYIHF